MTHAMLPYLLAQVPEATPKQYSDWLIPAGAVVVMAYYIIQIIQSFRPSPPLEQRYPSRDAHEAVSMKIASIESAMDKSEGRNSEQHKQIFDLLRKTSEQLAATAALEDARARQLIHVEEKLDTHISKPHKFS